MKEIFTIGFALLLAIARPSPARADGENDLTGASYEDAKKRAEPIFKRGLAMVKDQSWTSALDAFQEAYAILPSPIVRFNIAYCERALGQNVAALETLHAFVSTPFLGPAASRREEALDLIRDLETKVARLRVVVPADPGEGSEVFVDGRPVKLDAGNSFHQVIDPGRHTVLARREGFAPRFEERPVRAGEDVVIDLKLEVLPARLIVSSNVAGAMVLVDGKSVGETPWEAETAAGQHRVEVTAPGHFPHRSALNLDPGATAHVTADLLVVPPKPIPIQKRWWFWTGIGVVLAGVATGTYFLARPTPEPPPYETGSLGWIVGGQN